MQDYEKGSVLRHHTRDIKRVSFVGDKGYNEMDKFEVVDIFNWYYGLSCKC